MQAVQAINKTRSSEIRLRWFAQRLLTLLIVAVSVCVVRPLCAQSTLALTNATIETVSDQGTLENATLLIKAGKIEAIGTDVKIPVAATRMDLNGKTLIPGIVDPYFVVSISRNTSTSAPRTVVFNGRVFTIGGSAPGIATTFAKIADGLDTSQIDWKTGIRSGITTFHVVTGGYAQSLIAEPTSYDHSEARVKVVEADGKVLVTVSNETKSLDVLRSNLKPKSSRDQSRGASSAARGSRFASARASGASSGSRTSTSGSTSPTAGLWADVRDGKETVFVNVNNASAILHATSVLEDQAKAKVALIASGSNAYLTLENLKDRPFTLVLPPTIDRIPNSANRVNVARLLTESKVPFAFSLSLGQSDFRSLQPTPLFGAAMLVRAGLDRDEALKGLTLYPAKLLGLEKEVGSLEVGKRANFVVLDDQPFSSTTQIEQTFVAGKRIYDQSDE